jgi:transposase
MAVASITTEHGAAVVSRGHIGTRQGDLETLFRRLQAKSPQLVLVSEAGPWGFWLSRSRTHKRQGCWVVAPSRIPKKAGARVTTHRRDALTLACLMRAGDLTPVDVPRVADKTIRDRCRPREAVIRDLKAAKCRLKAFLWRHAIRYTGRATWGPAHRRWLREAVCPTRPRSWSSRSTSERSPNTPHGSSVWNNNSQIRCTPGGSPPRSTPSRPAVASSARGL